MGGGGGPCGVCESAAHLRCSGCGTVHYCGKEHQRQHWPQHRQECLPFKVISSPVAGRYLVSSRRLEAGQVVLQDTPLAVGPQAESPLVCLGCHDDIPGPDIPRCPSCWWPLCSTECASSPLHQGECSVLATDTKHIAAPKELGETPRYDIILLLRCLLLRDKNPAAWKELLGMAHHAEQRVANQELLQVTTVQYILDVLKLKYPPAQVNLVKGAIATNSLEVRTAYNTKLRAVYPRVRLLNHSCLPNVHLSSTTDSVIHARTTASVEPGEALCICYTNTTQPLWERLNILTTNYYFACECQRCSDPTEVGTHFSSPRCPECRGSFLEPRRWLGEIVWVCPTCNMEVSDAKVREGVQEWTGRLQMDDLFGGNSYKQAASVLKQVEEEFHPTHYMWMKVAQMTLYKLRNDQSYKALKLKRQLWQRLTALYTTLEPGLNKRRAMSLLELGVAMLQESKKEYEEGGVYLPVFVQNVYPILPILKESAEIFVLEPEGSPLKGMDRRANLKLEETEAFLKSICRKAEETRAE